MEEALLFLGPLEDRKNGKRCEIEEWRVYHGIERPFCDIDGCACAQAFQHAVPVVKEHAVQSNEYKGEFCQAHVIYFEFPLVLLDHPLGDKVPDSSEDKDGRGL